MRVETSNNDGTDGYDFLDDNKDGGTALRGQCPRSYNLLAETITTEARLSDDVIGVNTTLMTRILTSMAATRMVSTGTTWVGHSPMVHDTITAMSKTVPTDTAVTT